MSYLKPTLTLSRWDVKLWSLSLQVLTRIITILELKDFYFDLIVSCFPNLQVNICILTELSLTAKPWVIFPEEVHSNRYASLCTPCCSSFGHIHHRENHLMATPSTFNRQKTSWIFHIRAVFHLNVKNIPRKSQRLRPKHSRIRFLAHAANRGRPEERSRKVHMKSVLFPGALRKTFRDPRKSPEKSPGKLSGPRSFRVFWETHARPRRTPKSK